MTLFSNNKIELLWDTTTQVQIGQAMTGHQEATIQLFFSEDGNILYSTSDDGTIRLWDVETHLQISEFPGFDPLTALSGSTNARILDMDASPSGSILVVSNEQQYLRASDLSIETWIQNACFTAGRNLTLEEWKTYLGETPYQKTCQQFP